MELTLHHHCSDEEVYHIRQQLIQFNTMHMRGENKVHHVRHVYKNDSDEIVGGIIGVIYMTCLTIDFLWVSDALRGHGFGKQLLLQAEADAQEQHCHMILLDTFSFQAPDFYRSQGYEVHSVIADCPAEGVDRYFLKKMLIETES